MVSKRCFKTVFSSSTITIRKNIWKEICGIGKTFVLESILDTPGKKSWETLNYGRTLF